MSSLPAAAPVPFASPPRYAWQTCLNIADAPATPYQEHFTPHLLDVLAHAPRVLLDVGCSSGILGRYVKDRHPACRTIGIEPNHATAGQRLDQVLCGRFEDFVLEDHGIAQGSLDTVVMADVLEHMYDPWKVMVKLKPYLTADAQVILSIPNTRHLGLIQGLLDGGMWTYAEKGLLDITHIRFFTLKEIADLLTQTGYRLELANHLLDVALAPFYEQNKGRPDINFRLGRITINYRITGLPCLLHALGVHIQCDVFVRMFFQGARQVLTDAAEAA